MFKRHGVKVGMISGLIGKHKFAPMDIKRIYFGWVSLYASGMEIA